jgi:[ribosomal protein S18]-alanine N-acetyltransferase
VQNPFSDDLGIAEMTEEDLDEVVAIERVSFTSPWPHRLFKETIATPFSVNFVARKRVDNRMVGYANFYLITDEVQVLNIATAPTFRNKGYGTSLLAYAIERLTERGVRDFYLEVREGNKKAMGIYDKFGFKKIGKRKKYYTEPNEDAIVMHLTVNDDAD